MLVLALLCFWIPEDAFPIRKNKPATHSKQPQSQSQSQSTQEPATTTTEASLTYPSPPPSSATATHTDMPSPSASPRENDRAPLLVGVRHPNYTTNPAETAKGSAREVTVGQDGVLSSSWADDGGGEEGKEASSPPSVVEELLAVVTAPSFLVLTWGYAAYAAATMGFSTFGSSFLMGLGRCTQPPLPPIHPSIHPSHHLRHAQLMRTCSFRFLPSRDECVFGVRCDGVVGGHPGDTAGRGAGGQVGEEGGA